MKATVIAFSIMLALPGAASAFSYATGGCATGGCAEEETWLHTNANEVDTALDALESIVADGNKGDITLGTSGTSWMVNANSVALGTDTTGGYAASVSEGGPATTATALAANGGNCSAGSYPLGVDASGAVESCTDATTEIDAAVAAKSAASSTDNAVPKFDSTAGDVQNSGVLIDDSNNLTVPGDITSGTSGGTCMIFTDLDDGTSQTAVWTVDGVLMDEVDTNGVCGDAT